MLGDFVKVAEIGALMFVLAIIFEARFERFQFFQKRVAVRYGLAWILGVVPMMLAWGGIGVIWPIIIGAALLSAGLLKLKFRFIDRK